MLVFRMIEVFMRNEKEMFDLILDVARQDDRIRAVYMNGSRANPNVEKDPYRDYDIVYVVTETIPYVEKSGLDFRIRRDCNCSGTGPK